MKLRCLLILLAWGCATGHANAEQGCAPGFFPGGTQPNGPVCVPIPGYGTTNSTTSSPQPNNYWQLTWGAIATDEATGATGATVGHFSRGKAKRDAMTRCASLGGRDCKVILAYKNQCAVIADPVEGGKLVPGTSISQSGPSIQEASDVALKSCNERNGGKQCQVLYSDCSKPVLIRN